MSTRLRLKFLMLAVLLSLHMQAKASEKKLTDQELRAVLLILGRNHDSGSLAQQAYIKASNTDAADQFGRAVALSGETLAVGAWIEASNATGIGGDQFDNSAGSAGAVYVSVRGTNGAWNRQAYLKASNTEAFDLFGWRIALDGDTLAVGAPQEASSATGINGDQSDNSADNSGAVYLFYRDVNGIWSQRAYLKASNAEGGDQFGWSVALSGDTLAVGAWQEDSSATGINGDQSDNSAGGAGAVYVFTRAAGGNWSQQAYIKASNTDAFDLFGQSVALDGDSLAVGAQREASSATGVNGDQADNSTPDAGAAYLFIRDASGIWSQEAYIKASNTGPDLFSHAISVDDKTLAVGSPFEASSATGVNGDQLDNSAGGAGAVYVFTRDVWLLESGSLCQGIEHIRGEQLW